MICDFFCKDNLQRIFILELTNLYLILYLPQVLKQSLDVIKCHQIISFVFQVLFFFRKILLFLSQMYAFIICHKAVVLNEPRESEGPLVVRLLCVCVLVHPREGPLAGQRPQVCVWHLVTGSTTCQAHMRAPSPGSQVTKYSSSSV